MLTNIEKIAIFEVFDEVIFALEYDSLGMSEYERLLKQWTDNIYLYGYYKEHVKGYDTSYFGELNDTRFVRTTRNNVRALISILKRVHSDFQKNLPSPLDQLFLDLEKKKIDSSIVEKKVRDINDKKNWLRLYAIEYQQQYYITGGAIKITQKMQDHPMTTYQLELIRFCRDKFKEILNGGFNER